MRSYAAILAAVLFVVGCSPPWSGGGNEDAEKARAAISRALHSPDSALLPAASSHPEDREQLGRFYQSRGYAPAWTEGGFHGHPLLVALAGARSHGLDPGRYRSAQLESLISGGTDELSPEDLARVDLALTAGFIAYASDLDVGRARASQVRDLVPVLEQALAGDATAALEAIAPKHPMYARLRNALQTYHTIAETPDWPALPNGELAKPGEPDARAPLLWQRLQRIGDLAPESSRSSDGVVDDVLVSAVRHFQKRNGLEPTGHLDDDTVSALDVAPADRVRQIEANLERWRWLPDDTPPRMIIVNIPEFRLRVVEDGKESMSMRVIVGKPEHPTPILNASMNQVVLNPYWNIPTSITRKEILPKMLKDPSYATRNGIEVVRVENGRWSPIGSERFEWSRVGVHDSHLRLRQRPGPRNSLGRVQFRFPNPHDVYLHDTPADELFDRADRELSHGCVRVSQPVELAEYVLQTNGDWDRVAIAKVIETGERKAVDLKQPIPVLLVYFTAWVDPEGQVQFRNDVYGWDANETAARKGRTTLPS